MQQEANTVQRLLETPATIEMGFDLAKQAFDSEDVRHAVANFFERWLFAMRRVSDAQQVAVHLSGNTLFGRMSRFLQIMGMTDDNGNRIEELGTVFTPRGYSSTGSGNSIQPGAHPAYSSGYTRTGIR